MAIGGGLIAILANGYVALAAANGDRAARRVNRLAGWPRPAPETIDHWQALVPALTILEQASNPIVDESGGSVVLIQHAENVGAHVRVRRIQPSV